MRKIISGAVGIGLLASGIVYGLIVNVPRTQNVPIFMLHRVAETDSPGDLWTLKSSELERIVGELKNAGFRSVFPDEIIWRGLRRHSPVSTPVVLTFDDGDLTLLTTVEPILRRQGFKAMVYVSTANIADTPDQRIHADGRDYLTWTEIRALRAGGVFEFGAHGYRHILAEQLTDPDAEVRTCLAAFETRGGFRPTSYSYPFGAYTKSLVAALRRAGFTTAVTCTEKTAPIAFGAKSLKLPRIWVRGGGEPIDLTVWLGKNSP
jgi:peptidoglycan/xylan/chitin deacetylase (PgdA/CDA1 family)